MPESIILHFSEASASEIVSILAENCEPAADRGTYFYPSNATYVLLMSEYTDYDVEYDEENRDRTEALLGRRPSFSLSIELRRSKQDAACDAASMFVSKLGASRNFVVDDCHQIWTRSEIQRADDFLQVYRSKEEPNQPPEPMPRARHG